MLRQIEVQLAQRKSPTQACKEAGISEQSYYRCAGSMGACSLSEQSA